MANKWIDKIGKKMLEDVEFMGRKNFRAKVYEGMRLQPKDIHKLN